MDNNDRWRNTPTTTILLSLRTGRLYRFAYPAPRQPVGMNGTYRMVCIKDNLDYMVRSADLVQVCSLH